MPERPALTAPVPYPVLPPLVAGTATLTAGSGPLRMLLVVSVVFGLQFGLTVVTNQAAMYAQAPANATGAAAGLLRTSMYLGAITSVSLISPYYGRQATDGELQRLAMLLTIAALDLLVTTITDRTLASQHRTPVRCARS